MLCKLSRCPVNILYNVQINGEDNVSQKIKHKK